MPTTRTKIDAGTVAGRSITVTLEVTEPDPVPLEIGWPRPVIGTNVDSTEFRTLVDGRNAGSRWCRTFSSPGDAILPWGHPRRAVPAGVAEFLSFKDWESDDVAVGWLVALLDGMPDELLTGPPLLPELDIYDPDGYSEGRAQGDGFSMLICYFHEGEKNFINLGLTPREWRRRHRLVYRTIRTHRNGHRVGYMPIQTGTWTEAKSDPARGIVKGDFDPFTWWAGIGDYAGYDAYPISVTNKPPAPGLYPTPAKFLEIPLQLAAGVGRRLFLAELAVIRQGAPADTGILRGAWIPQTAAYAAAQGVAGIGWWDDWGANNRDFRLTDQASAAAWGRVLAGTY